MEAPGGDPTAPSKTGRQVYISNISRINHSNFTTRDQLEQEVNNLRSNLANLEALQHNTKVSLEIDCKTNRKYKLVLEEEKIVSPRMT